MKRNATVMDPFASLGSQTRITVNDHGLSAAALISFFLLLLVFSVTPFKIDQNENQNRPIDKVQNLGNKRRYIYKDPSQDSGQRNISYTRYPKKCFTQIYRDLYGDATLVLTWMSSWRTETNRNICCRVLQQKREFIPQETHEH